MMTMESFEEILRSAVQDAFEKLLSEKHLYQCVELRTDFVQVCAEEVHRLSLTPSIGQASSIIRSETAKERLLQEIFVCWVPENLSSTAPIAGFLYKSQDVKQITFSLPTIHTFCQSCNGGWPFNPVYDGMAWVSEKIGKASQISQSFYLGYQCQSCKGQPIRFLVRREGLKIRLVGRDPIEVLPVPKVLPKSTRKLYSDALIAHHAGQTLAGLFLLRVFVEQFWLTIPEVKALRTNNSRATGDELGEAYQRTLPTDFKDRFPSLAEVYGKLSAAIHSADANAELFDQVQAKLVKHFEARSLFDLAL